MAAELQDRAEYPAREKDFSPQGDIFAYLGCQPAGIGPWFNRLVWSGSRSSGSL